MTKRDIEEIGKYIYDRYIVKTGIDGWKHILQTVHFGIMIAAGENIDVIDPVVIGCYLHDIGRGREKKGQSHGEAGYQYCLSHKEEIFMYLKKYDISETVFEEIIEAVRIHDKGKITNHLISGCIWDADRLSLVRFNNKIVNPDLLSTNTAKKLIDYANRCEI
ncbi:MAG: HD domain-containing protein [Lachnospiraceae bacterium]|nr:HD domain-containing protein [Lachnospiraceae bacterium]